MYQALCVGVFCPKCIFYRGVALGAVAVGTLASAIIVTLFYRGGPV